MIARLDHVQVAAPAGGEGAARAFYGELLGLPELPKPERLRARGGVWFAVGDQQLHVGIEEPFAPARKAAPRARRAARERSARARRGPGGRGPPGVVGRAALLRRGPVRQPARAARAPRRPARAGAARRRARLGAEVVEESWGAIVIAGGREHRPAALPALVAEDGGERAGLTTYLIEDDDCEVVTLDALTVGGGIGGALVEALADTARAAGCTRLHLTTTNDNLPALRLYQRHGFVLAGVHLDEIEVTRRSKPEIPATGHAGIPIRDEIELERPL